MLVKEFLHEPKIKQIAYVWIHFSHYYTCSQLRRYVFAFDGIEIRAANKYVGSKVRQQRMQKIPYDFIFSAQIWLNSNWNASTTDHHLFESFELMNEFFDGCGGRMKNDVPNVNE